MAFPPVGTEIDYRGSVVATTSVALDAQAYDASRNAREYLNQTLAPSSVAALRGVTIKSEEVVGADGATSMTAVVATANSADAEKGMRAVVDLMVAAKSGGLIQGEFNGDVPGPKADKKELETFLRDNHAMLKKMEDAKLLNGELASGASVDPKTLKDKGFKAATKEGEEAAQAKVDGSNELQPSSFKERSAADAFEVAGTLTDGILGNDHKVLKERLGIDIGEGNYVTAKFGEELKAYIKEKVAETAKANEGKSQSEHKTWKWTKEDALAITEKLLTDKDKDGKADFVKTDQKGKDPHVSMDLLAKSAGADLLKAGVIGQSKDFDPANITAQNLQGAIDQAQEQAQGAQR